MNKYKKKLFQHLDGIVLIPTLLGLEKSGILKEIITKKEFSINSLSKEIDFNAGYLNVSLRVLTSSGLIINNNDENELKRIYKINNNLIKLIRSLKTLNELDEVILYHKKFKKLQYSSLIEYTNLVYTLTKLIIKNKSKFTKKFYNNIEGMIFGPLLANLSFYKHIESKSRNFNLLNLDSQNKKLILDIFRLFDLYSKSKNALTEKGKYFISRSSSYGVTVSYLNTLSNIDKLLIDNPNYIWQRTKHNHEVHVDRSMNVWGSGGAHKVYFEKIDDIIIDIFNKDIKKQPVGVIDIGCGDGTFLKHIYSVIISRTERKKHLKSHPLILIGTDINKKAQISTQKTLKGINSIIIDGDISNPKKINNILKEKHNLKLKDFLNCRTFLDHNRIYRKPNRNINHKISTSGSFSFKGRLIPGKELITNFILHLLEWKKFIKAHGLIAVELHTLDPVVTLKNSGNSLACAYDATHGYSDQYLIEYEVYKKCILEIGMNITSDNEYLFPRKIPTVSINYIK